MWQPLKRLSDFFRIGERMPRESQLDVIEGLLLVANRKLTRILANIADVEAAREQLRLLQGEFDKLTTEAGTLKGPTEDVAEFLKANPH